MEIPDFTSRYGIKKSSPPTPTPTKSGASTDIPDFVSRFNTPAQPTPAPVVPAPVAAPVPAKPGILSNIRKVMGPDMFDTAKQAELMDPRLLKAMGAPIALGSVQGIKDAMTPYPTTPTRDIIKPSDIPELIKNPLIKGAKMAYESPSNRAVGKAIYDTFKDSSDRINGMIDTWHQDSTLKKATNVASSGVGILNNLLSPITAISKEAENLPGLRPFAWTVNNLFSVMGGAGGGAADAAVDEAEFLSPETKTTIKPVVTELASLLAEIGGGYASSKVITRSKDLSKQVVEEIKNDPVMNDFAQKEAESAPAPEPVRTPEPVPETPEVVPTPEPIAPETPAEMPAPPDFITRNQDNFKIIEDDPASWEASDEYKIFNKVEEQIQEKVDELNSMSTIGRDSVVGVDIQKAIAELQNVKSRVIDQYASSKRDTAEPSLAQQEDWYSSDEYKITKKMTDETRDLEEYFKGLSTQEKRSEKGQAALEKIKELESEIPKVEEQFINKQNNKEPVKERTVYRASKESYDPAKMSSDGIFTSPDKKFVENWAKSQGYKVFEEFNIPNDTKILNIKDFPKEFIKKEDGYTFYSLDDQAKIIEYAKQKGYDGFESFSQTPDGTKMEPEIVVWNKDKIKVAPATITKEPSKPKAKPVPLKASGDRLVTQNIADSDGKVTKKEAKINDKPIDRTSDEMTKTDLKNILNNLDEDSIVMEVSGDKWYKSLDYKKDNMEISIDPAALGINKDNLTVGQKITLAREDLNAKGSGREVSTRVVNDKGEVLASTRGKAKNIDQFEILPTQGSVVKPENFKIHNKVRDLIKKYAVRIAEGDTGRGAVGIYNNTTNTIRVKGMNDFPTAVHEITHHLDLMNQVTDGLLESTGVSELGTPLYAPGTFKIRKEMNKVYMENYPTARESASLSTRMKEGYAMLIQKYVESPTYIKEKYPLAYETFIKEGGKFYRPVVGEILKDLSKIVTEYQSLTPMEKTITRLSDGNTAVGKDSFLNTPDALRTYMADHILPAHNFADETGAKGADNPGLLIRAYSDTNNYFANNVFGEKGYWTFDPAKGEFTKKLDFNWGSLYKKFDKNDTGRVEFDGLLIARRTHFAYEELFEMGHKIKKMEDDGVKSKELEGMQKEYNALKSVLDKDNYAADVAAQTYFDAKDKYSKELEMFDNLIFEDLNLMHKVHMIDDAKFKKLSSVKGYAAFKREFYNELVGDETVTTGLKPNAKVSSLITRTGSSRSIISPLMSGVKGHAETIQKAVRQHINNKWVEAEELGNVMGAMEKVEVKKAVDQNGKISYPQEKDPTIIMGFNKKGERVALQVDAEIKKYIDNAMTPASLDGLGKIFAGGARIFTKGTTVFYQWFPPTNLILDQASVFMNTKNGTKALIDPLKTLYRLATKSKSKEGQFLAEYLTIVGDRLTLGRALDMNTKEYADYIMQERKGILKATDAISKGLEYLGKPGELTEHMSRGSEFVNARMKGKSQAEAMYDAANITGAFKNRGSWGTKERQASAALTLLRSVAYANASLVIFDRLTRELQSKQGSKKIALLAGITALVQAGAFASITSFGTDEQKETYKDLDPVMLTKYVYFPSQDGKTLVKIRWSEAAGTPATIINMLLSQKYLDVHYSPDEFTSAMTATIPQQINIANPALKAMAGDFKAAGNAFAQLGLSWVPTLAQPTTKVSLNYTTFPTIRPLESIGQQRKAAEDRYTPSTPELTKKIGQWTGKHWDLSPIMLDALIVGHFGRATNFITGKPGILNPVESIFKQKGYLEGGRRMQEYYDIKERVDQDYNTYNISDKIKAGQKLTDDEYLTAQLRQEMQGYGRGEAKYYGVDDYVKAYKAAVEAKDDTLANQYLKEIVKKIENINEFKKVYDEAYKD